MNSTATMTLKATMPTVEHTVPESTNIPSSVLHAPVTRTPLQVISASGSWLTLSSGRKILDSTGGAAVSCIGHGSQVVKDAMIKQLDTVEYCHSFTYGTPITEQLGAALIATTDNVMRSAVFLCSGSEAMEGAIKLSIQYFVEKGQPERNQFISRNISYHGATIGALSMSGHLARRKIYEDVLPKGFHKVSACNAYRFLQEGETEQEYVQRLKEELEAKFQEIGPGRVAAFVVEPVVGAASGCVVAPPGYLEAMREVCDKHGALLVLDEIMCGMGRCGTMHAWQVEGVTPDIQTLGKGLGGGYAPIAAILLNQKVYDALADGTGIFSHSQTYFSHPMSCAASLAVIGEVQKLLPSTPATIDYLEKSIKSALQDHPHVGDIRGRGFFWGVEFVEDKKTKKPFPLKTNVALRVHERALKNGAGVYPGNGCADGVIGDHVLIAPAYNISRDEIDLLARIFKQTVEEVFEEVGKLDI